MVEQLSPLAPVWQPGPHGNAVNGVGVMLSEVQPGSIVQTAAWIGQEEAVLAAIAAVVGLKLTDGARSGVAEPTRTAFGFAPRRFLITDEAEDLADRLTNAIPIEVGTVTDLSHARTALRIAGPKAEWVLSKLFAIDFSAENLPQGAGISTNHHDVFAQIQRTGPAQFDIYVFRSFARSFWHTLCRAAEEIGYEVR